MDILAALEEMVQTTASVDSYAENVDRWVKLFGYTTAQAERAIEAHFQNLSRIIISNEQWNIMRNNPETQGHDQESYAHHLMNSVASLPRQQQPTASATKVKSKRNMNKEYLVKLVAGLTAAGIQSIAGLIHPPRTVVDDTNTSTFAVISSATRAALEAALPPGLVFAPLPSPAQKDLSNASIAPTLGLDATLPHHRSTAALPRQDQYPVPYFFYGTLAEPDRLKRLLDLDHEPRLVPAMVPRGKVRQWGPYFALVDGTEKDRVDGWVYEVRSEGDEDELRRYESGNYEVVRCEIYTEGEAVPGLTFRFCGDEEMLE